MSNPSKKDIKDNIDRWIEESQVDFFHYADKLTYCVITLLCGFTVIGEAICADLEEFNKADGEQHAFAKASNELWTLEYYRLASES